MMAGWAFHVRNFHSLLLADFNRRFQELNRDFSEKYGRTFEIGIGIHSGSVCRGNIGSRNLKKYTVIGSTVNVASRLCSLAGPAEVLISQETKSCIGDEYRLEQLEAVKVKNVTEPLVPYRVLPPITEGG